MASNYTQTNQVSLKPIMTIELFIASALPVVAILIIGAVGTQQMAYPELNIFVPTFLLCAVLTFIGEIAILRFTHRTIQNQIADLIAVCQERIVGNKERRALIPRDNELAVLSRALNALLDMLEHERSSVSWEAPARSKEAPALKNQLKRLLKELSPVMDGDLRARAGTTTGDLSAIVHLCNHLIEEFSLQIKSIRYASAQIMRTMNTLLDHSVQQAQVSETQMLSLSQMTLLAERVMVFNQHLSNTLQISLNIAREKQQLLQEGKSLFSKKSFRQVGNSHTAPLVDIGELLEQLDTNTKQQIQLLEKSLLSRPEGAILADALVKDLYAFAQNMYHSSTSGFSTAEYANALITLAEQWQKTVAAFRLAEDTHQKPLVLDDEMDDSFFDALFASAPMRAIRPHGFHTGKYEPIDR